MRLRAHVRSNGIAIAVPTVAALLIVAVAIASYRRAKGKSCCARARSDSNMVYPQVDGAASVQEVTLAVIACRPLACQSQRSRAPKFANILLLVHLM